jgi:tRNA(Ile)-lysidine synthase
MTALTDNEFHTLMVGFTPPQALAVAVSGGADSMALTWLASRWAQANAMPFYAITVDHKLRPDSTAEAHHVHAWLQGQGIHHTVLTWDHTGVCNRLQEKARQARYALLADFCSKHKIDCLLTAHHLHDQWETFMMRLAKGSGLRGLCAMRPCVKTSFGVHVRPLLSVAPHRLRETLAVYHIPFVEDPSNQKRDFARVRLRQLMPILAAEGLTPEALTHTVKDLQEVDSWIVQEVRGAKHHYWDGSTLKSHALFAQVPPLVVKRLLQEILHEVGGMPYPISRGSLQRLIARMHEPASRTYTAGRCCISMGKQAGAYVARITREERG